MSYWSFQARLGLLVLMKNATYLQYFSFIFQEENHNISLLVPISLDSNPINPGIPHCLGFVIQSDSHIRDEFGTETPDEWKINKLLWYHKACYHNVSHANINAHSIGEKHVYKTSWWKNYSHYDLLQTVQ